MINWIEITKDNLEIVKENTENEKYVFLTIGKEIVNEARINPDLNTINHFCLSRYYKYDMQKITHFALRSEYEAILPNAQKHDDLPIIPVHDTNDLS